MLKLNNSGVVKDLVFSYFSERQIREVEISVDDIVTIYEDDSLEVDDVNGVGGLIKRFVEICKDDNNGSLEFCVDARDELVNIRSQIEESANKMRMMEDFRGDRRRTFRRIKSGSRERNKLLEFIEHGLEELDESIKNRKFLEGEY